MNPFENQDNSTAEIKYPAVLVKNGDAGKPLVLFSAPAFDINKWVGVPQKLKLGDDETTGFQRTVSTSRRSALQHFFSIPENVMQNPLLCAIRNELGVNISFEASAENCNIGFIHIKTRNFSRTPLHKLFTEVRCYLEERVPELSSRPFPDTLYRKIESQFTGVSTDFENQSVDSNTQDELFSDGPELEEALFDDSQIAEFWDQIKVREFLAEKLSLDESANELVGFTREVLESYLRPVVLVDGQHRLAGAVDAAKAAVNESPELKEKAQDLVSSGKSADDALEIITREQSRLLPVSLLLDASPAEHVFQFVVVNQKATPVPKALLGTIISTSLAASELTLIKERLVRAEIPLESSQAVSSLARSHISPFSDKVARGFEQESGSKLPWTVLASLAEMFRSLRGAKYYHEPSLDNAAIWKEQHLDNSEIVSEWQARDFSSPFAYWSDANGPWRDVFIEFWTCTRDKLANVDDPDSHNFWGNPRKSNIFNKPSLFILATDFFSFLREQRANIDSLENVKSLVDEWLKYVDSAYFKKDWKLSNVKKDSVGTRKQWSYLWYRHRSASVMPRPEDFGKLRRD